MKRALTSAPSLASVCELVADTPDCKIIAVKRGSELALASMGYFTGLETQFRVLFCGSRATLTVWRSDGKISQWDWSRSEDRAIPDPKDSKLSDGAKAMIGKVWFAMATLLEESEA